MTVQPFAYAWRWKGGATWKLTLTKKPNHHRDIEIRELFADRVASAPSPDGLREAAQAFIEAWDWWRVDEYDRECPSDEVSDLRIALSVPSEKGGAA